MNTKKSLITTVAAIFMTAVMHAQEASDVTAEKQLAQRKAELDAREKALNEREKMLAQQIPPGGLGRKQEPRPSISKP